MRALISRPGFAAAVAGALILLHIAVLPMLLRADEEFVYFGSTRLPESCSWRTVYGVPCPTCGMTRGVVLAMHGRLRESADMNAAAPVLVAVGLVLGLFLVLTGALRMTRRHSRADRFAHWTRALGIAGAASWAVVLAVNWIVTLRGL